MRKLFNEDKLQIADDINNYLAVANNGAKVHEEAATKAEPWQEFLNLQVIVRRLSREQILIILGQR